MYLYCCTQLQVKLNNFINYINKFFYSNKNDNIKLLSNKEPKYIQKIIFLKSNINVYIDDDILEKQKNNECNLFDSIEINELIKTKILNKKNLYISPGGLYGFYDFAICKFIKQKYVLKNYIYSGVSAGAWNSLMMTYKYKNNYNILIDIIFDKIKNNNMKSIKKIQIEMKNILLEKTSTDDYDLDKLFIIVSIIENNSIKNCIYTDFDSLENAIDCCIASSNIPFLTGDLFYKYQNKISYDGGFLKNKQIVIKKPNLIITNSMFGKKRNTTSLFDSKNNVIDLYKEGILDCKSNKDLLKKKILDNNL